MKTLKVSSLSIYVYTYFLYWQHRIVRIIFWRSEPVRTCQDSRNNGQVIAEVHIAVSETIAVLGKYANKIKETL
jgi:hypothetical protein